MFYFSAINRQSQLRTNISHIDSLWKSPLSKTLLWMDGEFIMHENNAYYFSYNDILEFVNDLDDPVYLGLYLNTNYFTCRIKHPIKKLESFKLRTLRQASRLCKDDHQGLLFYTQGILNWLQRHKFCSYCGSKTGIIQAGHVRQCLNTQCAKILYPKLDPAVIFSVVNKKDPEQKILLGRQASWDENRYSVIAGFVEPGESLEDAVKREAMEETGLKIDHVKYIASQSWPFPDSLMLGFSAESAQHEITLVDQELESADWFSAVEIITKVESGSLKMPFNVSISWHLIDLWFTQQTGYSLSKLEQP